MHLSYWSERLQQRYGLLIGFSHFYQQMCSTFENLKQDDGRYLKLFFSEAFCYNAITKKMKLVIHFMNIKKPILSLTRELT